MDAVDKPRTITFKGATDIVTETDKAAEDAILKAGGREGKGGDDGRGKWVGEGRQGREGVHRGTSEAECGGRGPWPWPWRWWRGQREEEGGAAGGGHKALTIGVPRDGLPTSGGMAGGRDHGGSASSSSRQ